MEPAWLKALIEMADRAAASVELGVAFLAASQEDRDRIRLGWNFGTEWQYPTPWRLACTTGELGSPYQRIVASLVLAGLEGREDVPEQIVSHSVAWHSCLLAGLDARATFSAVAAALPIAAATQLSGFANRQAADQAMEAFGLVNSLTVDGEVGSWHKKF